MRVTNEILDNEFDLDGRPRRVVSLLSAATETIEVLGGAACVVGVSEYCSRYVDLDAPVVGRYTNADLDAITALDPDLVLVTSGVQNALGRRLVGAGMPVYSLSLPSSIHGVLENILTVGALIDRTDAGRRLIGSMMQRLAPRTGGPALSTYAEIWFGRHMRTVGGRSFIADIVDLAGGRILDANSRAGYLPPDLEAVADARPRVMVGFSEPEYPIDFASALVERGWSFDPHLVVSTIDKGRNIIHDGPSIVDTVEWLRERFAEVESA